MSDIAVVDWIDWSDDIFDKKLNLDLTPAHEDAVIDCIVKNRYRFSGDAHQHQPHGVPRFNDGKCYAVSMRSWGAVMSDAWNKIENKFSYDYMDFYVSIAEDPEQKMPTGKQN